MNKDEMREKVKQALKETKKDPYYKDIDAELEKHNIEEGPMLGPRNDIERRKLYNEIEKSGKHDNEEDV